jgi:hypothetical protein
MKKVSGVRYAGQVIEGAESQLCLVGLKVGSLLFVVASKKHRVIEVDV